MDRFLKIVLVLLALALPLQAAAMQVVAGDLDRDGRDDLIVVNDAGAVFYALAPLFTPWNPVTGATLGQVVVGDFNDLRLGREIAGLTLTGGVVVSPDLLTFVAIPGAPTLVSLVAADFNNDGIRDLAGLDAPGNIFVSTNVSTITPTFAQITGKLATIMTGDFNGDVIFEDIAGVSAAGKIWFTTGPLLNLWSNPTGTLTDLVAGKFNNVFDGLAGINATSGKVWVRADLGIAGVWTNIPSPAGVILTQLAAGDFNGGVDDLAGLTAQGKIYLSVDLAPFAPIPGTLAQITTGDFDANGNADLVGVNAAGRIWMNLDPSAGGVWTQVLFP